MRMQSQSRMQISWLGQGPRSIGEWMRCTPCPSLPLTHPQRAELAMPSCCALEAHSAEAVSFPAPFANASSSSHISRDVMHLMLIARCV